MKPKEFSFCIGKYYPGKQTINVTCWGNQVLHGTLEEAKRMKSILSNNDSSVKIFKLEEIK